MFFSSVVALTGCPRTVYAPASELPGLAPINMTRSEDYPTIRTREGESQLLAGPIQEITITSPQGPEPIGYDFNAGIVGDNLSVIDERGPRVYSLAQKPYLTINYTERRAGYIAGGVALIAGGLPLAIVGIAGMVEGGRIGGSGVVSDVAGGFIVLLGLAAFATGGGLTVGGILLATHTPQKPKPVQTGANATPTLHFGPGSAGLSLKF